MSSTQDIDTFSVSLIIPAYNEEKYIGACLDAIATNVQSHISEIIVVDNASTDRTAEIAGTYPGVTVVHEPNKGPTHARQRGYLASTGELLVYVDADTRPPSGWIEQIQEEFRKSSDIVCVSGPFSYYDFPPRANVAVKIWNVGAKVLSIFIGYLVIGGNFAIRRDVLECMGGFDQTIEFYGDDADIGRRAHAFGKARYMLKLEIPSSARRLKAQGLIRTGNLYAKNFFSIVSHGHPITPHYEDYR